MKTNSWNGPFEWPHKRKFLSITLVLSCIILVLSCKGQVNEEEKESDISTISDTLKKPQVRVKVNKQYDKNGKIVSYDSTYSYVYKGGSSQTLPFNNDSVFSDFRSYFKLHSPALFDKHYDNIFFTDSLFKYDFFNEDYFQKRFDLNQQLFSNFYKQMDSLKGDYLKETYGNQKSKGN
jgi:hypothetical protein